MSAPGKGSERAKSWLYVVVNPWDMLLRYELAELEAGRVAFDLRADRLVRLRPIREQLVSGAAMILDDLTRWHPETAEWEQTHDEGLRDLTGSSRTFASTLQSDEVFRDLVMKSYSSIADPGTSFDDVLITLAEWTLSKAPRDALAIPEVQKAWREQRDLLLARAAPLRTPVDESVSRQIAVDRDLLAKIEPLRWKIVDSFDIPAASAGHY